MSVAPKNGYEKMSALGETVFTHGFLFFLVVDMFVVGYLNSFPEDEFKYTEYMKYEDYIVPKGSGTILLAEAGVLAAGLVLWIFSHGANELSKANSNPNKSQDVKRVPVPQLAR